MCTGNEMAGQGVANSEASMGGMDWSAVPWGKQDEATPAPASSPQFSPGGKYLPGGSSYLIDPVESGRMSGSENMAQLHRAMWDDHKARFAPVQQMLVDRYQDPTYAGEQTQKAGLTMAGAFDRSREQSQRAMSRYGVTPTGDQAMAQQRSFERNKAGAVADAKNTAQTAIKDQKMGLMMGGLSTANSQRRG